MCFVNLEFPLAHKIQFIVVYLLIFHLSLTRTMSLNLPIMLSRILWEGINGNKINCPEWGKVLRLTTRKRKAIFVDFIFKYNHATKIVYFTKQIPYSAFVWIYDPAIKNFEIKCWGNKNDFSATLSFAKHCNISKAISFCGTFWKVLPYPDMAYVWCFKLNGPGKNVLEVCC